MKSSLEVVTGFLGAGKTTFINALIEAGKVDGEKILVYQMEYGISRIKSKFEQEVQVVQCADTKSVCSHIKTQKSSMPDHIIIEFNGTEDISQIFEMLKEKEIKKHVKMNGIYFIADCSSYNVQVNNLKPFINPFIKNSNVIVLNKYKEDEGSKIEERIRKVNGNAFLIKNDNLFMLKDNIKECGILENKMLKSFKIKLKNYLIH